MDTYSVQTVTNRMSSRCCKCGKRPEGTRLFFFKVAYRMSFPVERVYCARCGQKRLTQSIGALVKLRGELRG